MGIPIELHCPSFLHGAYRDANAAAGRFVTKLKRGVTIEEASGPLVPASSDPDAWIVVDRLWSAIDANRPQFHLDRPWRILTTRVRIEDAVFDRLRGDCLQYAWSFAGIVGSQEYWYVWRAAWQLEMIEAARVHLPVLERVGPRFSLGHAPEPISRATGLLGFALARQGAIWPPEEPLTSELLETECQRLPGLEVRAALTAGDVHAALRQLEGRRDKVVCSLAEHFLPYGLDREVCDAIRAASVDDPHGIVEAWLNGCGNSARMVR